MNCIAAMDSSLSKNTLAFIALAHEYCTLLENAKELDSRNFIRSITKLLPRIYISATDINNDLRSGYIEPYLDEDYYNIIRDSVSMLLGADDTYLEVFEDDMKYSDTPICASISESLADIFQELYNLLSNVKDAPNEAINDYVAACKENFENYWGQTLCNVMRPLNTILYVTNLNNI